MAEYTGALADIPTAREYNGALEGDESASLLRRFVADPAISLLGKGAIGVPETAVGVADLVTGGRVGKLVEDAGIRFEDAKAFLDDYLSPEQKEANRVVQETKGFFPTVGAALSNPSTIVHSALESLPSMGAGGVVARGAIAALPKLAPVVAGALGEGVVSAGAGAEQIRQQTTDGLLTPKQAAIAAGSGAMTGGLSLAGGKIAQRLGVNDIDTILAGEVARQTGKAGVLSKAIEKGGMPARIAGGVVAEGVLEELPQSMQEQAAQNLALDKPVGEGVAEAGAMGMLAGGVMGGGSAAFQRRDPVEDAKAKAAAGDPAKAAQDLLKTAMSDVLNGTDNLGVNRDRKKPDTAAGQAPAAQKEIAGIPKVGERITLDMEGDRIFGELIAARQTPDGWIVRVKDDDGQVIEATEKDATIYQPPKLGDISVPNNALDLLASQGKRDLPARVHTPVGEGTRADPVKVETSADVEAAAKVASTDYTPPQGEANNVQRAHVAWQGLDGTIEVAAGGTRKGTNPETGEAWATSHTVPYGYWKGSKGADGMHVDAYFGPEIEANHPVYVIDELDNDGNYRQAKTLIGFPSEAAAREAYLGTSTKNPENIGGVASFPVDEFKQLLKDGRFDRPVTEDVINGKKKLSRAVEDADVQALDEYEDALQQPEDPVLSQLRGEGDRRMPGVGERLPDVSAGRGAGDRAETDAETRTGQEGQRPGISAGERALGDEDGKRTEHPEGRKTDAPRQDAGRAGVGEGTGAASVNDSKAPGEGLVSANGSGDGKTASRKGAQSAKPSVLDQIRTAAEATGKKPAAVKAQFLKDKEAHGEEEALKRLPKPKPAPKLLGKNAKGQSVYEDENGVRSFSDGGVMITETMGLTPTRDGIKVSRGELKPEFKTVEEIAAEKPKEEPKPLTDEEQAKLDIANAIADLGEILLTKTGGKLNITPEQEQKLLPVMTRLFDAAFRLGHIKFKAAARFVRDQIRKALGDETADLLTIEHYQGGYISMSARYRDKGSETAKEVAQVETLDDAPAEEPKKADDTIEFAVQPLTKGAKAETLVVPKDLPASASSMYVELDGKRYPVTDLEDAKRKWDEFRDKSGGGASEIGNGVTVHNPDGSTAGRVSYNGRIWGPDGKEIGGIKDVEQEPAKPSSEAAGPTLTLVPGKHTKTGEAIFTVKIGERVERDAYTALAAKAKRLGGKWSRFTDGFLFKSEAKAKEFMGEKVAEADPMQDWINAANTKFANDNIKFRAETNMAGKKFLTATRNGETIHQIHGTGYTQAGIESAMSWIERNITEKKAGTGTVTPQVEAMPGTAPLGAADTIQAQIERAKRRLRDARNAGDKEKERSVETEIRKLRQRVFDDDQPEAKPDYAQFKGKTVSIKVPLEGGGHGDLVMDAADAMSEVDQRIDLMRQLVECLA